MPNHLIRHITTFAVFLALFVVMLGAYTRLTDAGLGCPDWPGCYGKLVLPSAISSLQEAQTKYPNLPIETNKAWTEMAHRYAAGTLALLIFFINFLVISRRKSVRLPWHLPLILMLLIFFQAALGMWTVTLKLLPIVVMGHLLGGILIFACLCRFRLQISSYPLIVVKDDKGINKYGKRILLAWRPWLRLAAVIVFCQIALGGWVSSNYAGISCIGFPQCNGLWVPPLFLAKAFNIGLSVGANYQGGVLDNEVRVTIQFVHRLGAVITLLYLLTLSSLILYKKPCLALQKAAMSLMILVVLQFILGVINAVYLLPIEIAVAHNGVAALLLASVFCMLHLATKEASNAR